MKNINYNWFKNKKMILLSLGICTTFGLTSCISNINKKEESSYNGYIDFDKYQIEIHCENYDQSIINNECFVFTTNDGGMYRFLEIDNDGIINSFISDNGETILSEYLNQEISLPETDEEHKIIVNVDYSLQKIDTEVVELENTKTR